MKARAHHITALKQYEEASERAADQIIRAYSTSFGAATKLLGTRHRRHVRNIYALVRVADELVDGVAAEAHLSASQQLHHLDALESETHAAVQSGYSSNPIVHAFASSARISGIDTSLTAPFFASMRTDLRTLPVVHGAHTGEHPGAVSFTDAAHSDYVYGSAEVIGLMCLRIFVCNERRSPDEMRLLERGARSLGAAFQNVNFLRDLADDTERLARNYLSGGEPLTEDVKLRWIRTIREQLAEAGTALPLLPPDARNAVECARRLFSRLTDKLERTTVEQLLSHRVRVSNPVKALLITQSLVATRRRSLA